MYATTPRPASLLKFFKCGSESSIMKKRIIVTLWLFSYGLVHTMDGILNSTLITIPKDYNMKYLWINGRWLRSENYPPTPPSVDCRLHYISGCFTYTRVTRGGVVTVGHALARHLLWSAKLYWNTCIFVFWKCPGRILVGHICSKWSSTTDARVKPQALSL